jgi:hypothetical protein
MLRTRLLLFALGASACGVIHAQEPGSGTATPPPAAASVSGSLELGISREDSQFTVVRIGDSPAILIEGDRVRSTETFRHAAATVNAALPCGGASTCVANLNADTHTGTRTSEVDTAIAQVDAGLQRSVGSAVYGVRAVHEHWKVGGSEFRRVDGVAFDAAASLAAALSAYFLVNIARYRHPGDSAVLDASYGALTGNLRWDAGGDWQSAFTLQATLSREKNRAGDPTLDVRGVLARVAWDAKPAPGWEAGASIIAQRQSFAEFDPVLGVRRVDRYTSVDFTLARKLADKLRLRLDLGLARYRSSAQAFNNDWKSIGAMLEWKF